MIKSDDLETPINVEQKPDEEKSFKEGEEKKEVEKEKKDDNKIKVGELYL